MAKILHLFIGLWRHVWRNVLDIFDILDIPETTARYIQPWCHQCDVISGYLGNLWYIPRIHLGAYKWCRSPDFPLLLEMGRLDNLRISSVKWRYFML